MKCVYCHADILRDDATMNHGAFHASCYDTWMKELIEELPLAVRQFAIPTPPLRIATATIGGDPFSA